MKPEGMALGLWEKGVISLLFRIFGGRPWVLRLWGLGLLGRESGKCVQDKFRPFQSYACGCLAQSPRGEKEALFSCFLSFSSPVGKGLCPPRSQVLEKKKAKVMRSDLFQVHSMLSLLGGL